MFKKSLASIVSAAVLVAGPGHLTLEAAAQTMTRGPVTGVSVTPTIGTGINSPVPGASSFNIPAMTPGALIGLAAAPSPVLPTAVSLAPVPASLAARPLPAAAKAVPATAKGSPLSVIESRDAKVGVAEKGAALNALFENSRTAAHEADGVLADYRSPAARASLEKAVAGEVVLLNAAIEHAAIEKSFAGGSLSDLGNLVKRAWNVVLGILGIGVVKMETPEVMAQRIIDQLNAAKPVYNRKVQEASTLVEKLKLQVEGETAKVAELEQGITALLSDSDEANNVMASGMINQQKTLNASIASTNEQIALAEKTLEGIKEERARFFSEREETIAKIQAGLTKAKAAEIQKQIAELKGGFSVGDLKDNMDRFEDAVNDKVADAKGTVDSVESNPDEILKRAKDSLKSQEIQDEIAKRKAAIEQAKKDKGAAGGSIVGPLKAVGVAVNVVMAVWAGLNTGWIAMLLGAGAVMGVVMPLASIGGIALGVFAEKVMKTSGAKTAGMALLGGVIGFGLGVVAVGFGGYVGYAVASQAAAIGLGVTALVTSLLDVAFKSIFKKDKPAAPSTDDKDRAGGLILELGIGAAVVAVIALVSAPFRNLLARAWNTVLGMLGLAVKKAETPEVVAQRIIDQLNAQKPVYNRKVQEASTLVEKLRLQIERQEAQSKELDRAVTAILSDSDEANNVMAESLLNQKKTVDASTALTKEQLEISEKTLVSIKEERASFFSEREELLAKIQAGLTKAKSAEIQKQIAELKGGFSVGDLKDNMDRFEDAVNDKVADAKGTVDSVESNPDEILKKAKDSLKNQEVQDEIAKRKAAIEAARKAKGDAAGDASQSKALGYFAKVIGIGFALISPWISAAVYSVLGLVAIAMAPEQGRWLGRQLAVIGLGTLVIGGAASLAVAKLGLTMGAFGVGVSFLVPAGIALAIGVIATIRANKKDGATLAAAAATPAGSSVTPAPVAAPVEASAPAASAPKASFSIKPLLDLIARAWNAILGVLGMGVKKMETPEIMAQRLIDQLNAAKPVYNNKVREASTLVEKLRLQIEGEVKKIAEFDRTITALLSDNDASNDIRAAGLLNSQKTLEASVAATREQLAASEKALEDIKEERARFFSEREETLAKIQSGLTKVKAAQIQKQIAELKGGFQIGDLKDNMGRFEDAVNDRIADAKGATDAVDSNPDQVLKKAKDSLRTQEIADELAKRKAAIEQAKKDKGAAGGKLGRIDPFLALMGLFYVALNPAPALIVVGVLAAISFGSRAVALKRGQGYNDDYQAGKFVGMGIGGAVGAAIFVATHAFTPFAIITPLAIFGLAGIHKLLARDGKGDAGGLILELGVGAAVVAVIALVSAPFRNLLARAWNIVLGVLGLAVKKAETPEVVAQSIIDKLNAQKPVYNRKVQEASTLVEKLRLQIERQEAQSKELDRAVTAILSDSDEANNVMAESLLNQKKTVDASTAMTKEQLEISEKTLVSIKEERASFFSECEELLAKIQTGLTKAKSAEIQKQIAELKGGFQIGDLKDNMDRFEDAVNDKVADAKGTVDSVESNPDEILKKAKDSLKNQEVQDEIAKRKAAIEAARKAKGAAGGAAGRALDVIFAASPAGILLAGWVGIYLLLGLPLMPWLAAGILGGALMLAVLAPSLAVSTSGDDGSRVRSKPGSGDLEFFTAMSGLLGVGAAALSGFWPVAAVAIIASGAASTVLTFSYYPADINTVRAHHLASIQDRAAAVGMALYAAYALAVGAAVLPALIGAGVAAAASYWHARRNAAQGARYPNDDKGAAGGKKDASAVNPRNWLYLKIGAALVGFLAALALVPEALIPQALSQIGGALFLSWIFGKSDRKLDAIAFSVAIAAMIAVPLLAPAAMVVTALGAVGTAYLLFLLFA